ncbi:hypothetical protein NFI96_018753, partial [Prochilodus magdalenae]
MIAAAVGLQIICDEDGHDGVTTVTN